MAMLRCPSRLLQLSAIAACFALSNGARADELADVQRLHNAGQSAEAMQRAEQFLAARPKDAQMRFMKGVMLSDARRQADAVEVFEKLTEDYPDLAEPYNNLAALYATAGDFLKARVTLEQALRNNPGYATAHENLGDVYVALAGQSYQRALKFNPTNTTAVPKLALARELIKRSVDLASPAASN